jgi:hypothetical protein
MELDDGGTAAMTLRLMCVVLERRHWGVALSSSAARPPGSARRNGARRTMHRYPDVRRSETDGQCRFPSPARMEMEMEMQRHDGRAYLRRL